MTFEAAATAPLDISSSDSEELGDTSLDPELQAIALQIATRRAVEEAEEEASKPSWAGDEVALTIRMQANPTIVRTAANQKGLAFYEKPLTTKLGVVRRPPAH